MNAYHDFRLEFQISLLISYHVITFHYCYCFAAAWVCFVTSEVDEFYLIYSRCSWKRNKILGTELSTPLLMGLNNNLFMMD